MPGKQHLQYTSPGFVNCPVCSTPHLPTQTSLKDGVYGAHCVNCGHLFKFKSKNLDDPSSTITFTVNGQSCTVSNEYAASTTLVHYLRETRLSVGTKAMCYEGGCGVCLVSMKLYQPVRMERIDYAVNSCLLPLYACDGHEITTIEGLGSMRKGLHPIQDRLAKKDGAQCGYCSSGQVMNMFGILQENPKPTMQFVEDSYDATICRCTGYRPILDAMKSFAVDAPKELGGGLIDIEELDAKVCDKDGKPCTGHCSSSSNGNSQSCHGRGPERSAFPTRPVHIMSAQAQWFKPTTLDGLAKLLKQYKTQNYRITFGNTGSGVFKELAMTHYDIIIDVRGIMELYGIDFDPTIVLGSNISINNLLDLFDRTRTEPATPYAGALADHLKYVAMNGIRNLGCWAGNLMMKHKHKEFPSDIFTCLETIGAQLLIMDEDGNNNNYTLPGFLNLDMAGKVIIALLAPTYDAKNFCMRTYRTSLRLQACHSYSVAGIRMEVDESQNFLVKSQPSIVMLGMNDTFIHATLTEGYLVNKKLGDPAVLKQALLTLASELKPSYTEGQSSAAYRKSLGLSMFYKYCLDICKTLVDPRYVSGGPKMDRPLNTGTRDYGTNKADWPLTEPMPKTIGGYLTSGAPLYIDDKPPEPDQLNAAVVFSTVANAKLGTIDASAALAYPGVKAFVQAKDIPTGGVNNWRGAGLFPNMPQELLSSGTILYAGQPIGIIVADLETTARHAATLVKVTYTDVQPPLLDLKEAVSKKSFFPNQAKPTTVGDPTTAIKNAPHQISGNAYTGDQYHFHMETQTVVCSPTDTGGMKVNATTQWVDGVLETVAQVLGLPQCAVTVELERLGGAFGGKITQNFMISGLCALASHVTGKPMKLHLDIHDNMKMMGKRASYYYEYQVGVDNSGKLLGVNITVYEDCGSFEYEACGAGAIAHVDNAYYCANWLYTPVTVKTNKPSVTACRAPAYFCPNWLFTPTTVKTDKLATTYCRSPVSIPGIFVIETIMDHVAKVLNLNPMDVRKNNLYVQNQTAPTGDVLSYCNIRPVVAQLEIDVDTQKRVADVDAFNKANRWRKRGISLMPNRFGITWEGGDYNTMVSIFHGDGSVAISHGGIDCGQGINTKVIQVCAFELGIPLDTIQVKKSSSIVNANSITTGGSVTSELCCKSVVECCSQLKARMAPVKAKMKDPSWKQLVAKCQEEQIQLTASYMTAPQQKGASKYSCYSCALVEAEIDVLTGQYQILQSDMLYDAGDSMNPELDMGQAEGAFMMGLGYFLMEGLKFDTTTGELLNPNTWEYKPPMGKDLPIKFNFKFERNVPNPLGVLNAKAIGEPPLTMTMAAFLAVKHAIEEARSEVGQTAYFPLDAPCTVDKIQTLCLNDPNDYVYKPGGSKLWGY